MIGLVAAVAAVAATGAVLMARVRRYRELLSFDPDADQLPGFAGEAMRAVPIDLTPAGFVWPHVEVEVGETIVLEAAVQGSVMGRFMDPCLQASGPLSIRRTYLERGARGRRYMALGSGPLARSGEAVALYGCRLRWQSGPARLWIAPTHDVRRGATLVIAPHSDDAELAAFGLMGPDAWVVTVSAGEVGTFAVPGHESGSAAEAWARTTRRAADSLAAARVAGVPAERVILLGYPDGRLLEMRAAPGIEHASRLLEGRSVDDCRALHRCAIDLPPVRPTWQCLVADLRRIVRKIRPQRIVVPHPTLDLHGDHAAAFFAVGEALLAEGDLACDLLCYANHRFGARGGRNPQPFGSRDGCTPLPWSPSPGPHYAFPVSVPLGEVTARRKLAALAEMIDVAAPMHRRAGMAGAMRTFAGRLLHGAVTYDLSFFRRNVRPDELFYVIPAAELSQWLARLGADDRLEKS